MKQILVWMDATAARRFIVQDLDDTHLVVHADSVEYALKALEEHVCLCLVEVCELDREAHLNLLAGKEYLQLGRADWQMKAAVIMNRPCA